MSGIHITFISLVVLVQSCAVLSPSAPNQFAETQSETQTNVSENKSKLNIPLLQPRIVIKKSERRLELYSDGQLVRTYRAALGASPVDDKEKEGDMRTPEGSFYIFTKNDKSAYYLSLGLSYPNIEDAERGLRDGLISRDEHGEILIAINKKRAPPQKTALGGEIYIHGNGSQSDWTWGCIALENADMRELFDAVPIGTEVVIEH